MRKVLINCIIFFRIERIINYAKILLNDAELKRLERECGSIINYVPQGFQAIKIMSATGDYSKFKIHPTSHLKSDTIIECSGGVTIGRYFHTGRGLTIFSTNHNYNSSTAIPYDGVEIPGPVVIKDFVWSGSNVTIVPGVTIGEGVVIAAGTVVTKDVPDYAVIGGNPHCIIKYRDIEMFKQLKKDEKFC